MCRGAEIPKFEEDIAVSAAEDIRQRLNNQMAKREAEAYERGFKEGQKSCELEIKYILRALSAKYGENKIELTDHDLAQDVDWHFILERHYSPEQGLTTFYLWQRDHMGNPIKE